MTYDITPPITPKLAVWPGDTPLSREVLNDVARGDNITLSTLRATMHLGAHADGPNHYGKDAPAIDERGLDYFLGPCQVIRVGVACATCITPEMLSPKVSREMPAGGGNDLASRAAASHKAPARQGSARSTCSRAFYSPPEHSPIQRIGTAISRHSRSSWLIFSTIAA